MHYTEAKGILSANNGMNMFRGCTHGCIYCDTRSACYNFTHEFEDVEVKRNAVDLLAAELKRKRKKCMIGTGAMCDPYAPIERELEFMRRAMELVLAHGFGMTVQTKSADILRDLDLIKQINEKTKFVVQMTLTTADDTLCKKIEPNVSATRERVEALKVFQSNGIPTVVWLCPILSYINDTAENVTAIVDYCAESGVKGIINFGMGLTLRDGNREYFYSKLDELFPGMKEKYISRFGNSYEVGSPIGNSLSKLFHALCNKYGIMHDNDKIFAYLHEFPEQRFEQIGFNFS